MTPDTHVDPDGKRWVRVHSVTLGPDGHSGDNTQGKEGDRWVLERPEPETEEWVRLVDVVAVRPGAQLRLLPKEPKA